MPDLLNIVSASTLTDVKSNEIGVLIDQMIEKSKNNAEEISELTLECTALLTSAGNKAAALSEQGVFKRLIGDVTGKNRKLQNAIINDNTNALYAAQTVINRVMRECTDNRTLLIAVNDRVSDLYLELAENQNEVLAQVSMMRKGFVAFYKEFLKENAAQLKEVEKVKNFQKSMCPKCRCDLLSWQRICPNCGYIHPLKTEKSSKETKEILSKLSKVINYDTSSDDILWDLTAKKIDATLRKVKIMAELGELSHYPKDLESDINALMKKCRDVEFQIAVVGVMKAGKSFLMNALIGAEIASVEVNPETAALTKFRSASGYYVKVKFHNKDEWQKLKDSVLRSENSFDDSKKQDSFATRLKHPKLKEMEAKHIGQKELLAKCKDLTELKEKVKMFTSSQHLAHILVSEIEVGIDRSIFDMPKEVVFVDTPGLKDPVKYRSDITEKYIKQANAVLVALKPEALTAEGLEVVSKVLDITDKSKAIIVGTQIDKIDADQCIKIEENWTELLVNAKRYENQRDVKNKIIFTSAKMELLLKKWNSLSIDQQQDESVFSTNDLNNLESYVKKMLGVRRSIDISNLSPDQIRVVSDAAGITALRRRLKETLISKYRIHMVEDIVQRYKGCKMRIIEESRNTLEKREARIASTRMSNEDLKAEIENAKRSRNDIVAQTNSLKRETDKLIREVRNDIASIEQKLLSRS